VRPSASAEARGRPTRAIPLVCDTLWIDTDRALACLVWRGHLAIDSQDEYGLVTVCDEKDLQSTGELRAAVGLAQGGALHATAIQDRDEEPAEVEYQHTATDGETIAHSQAVPPLDPLPFRRPAMTALRSVPEPPPSWAPVAVPAPASTPSPSGLRETVGQRAAPRPKAEPEARHVLEVAALAGAVQASHAAADQVARESSSGAARVPDAPLDVVWLDPAVAARVRARTDWKTFHREPETGPLDDESRVKDARVRADRATIAAVVARAEPVLDIEAFVLGSVSEDGALEPRLAVVAGAVEWTFDEIETLKIWTATAAALAPGDKRVKELVDLANETMATPLGGEADVAASFVVRLREAWCKAQKSLPNDYIDSHARRLLLQERKYQKKTFGDAEWLRGALSREGSDTPVPIYIPATAARSLPLFVRIEGRILGDLVPQQDETEKSTVAVRVAALGRVVGARGRVG
jgi:hypothetical protein